MKSRMTLLALVAGTCSLSLMAQSDFISGNSDNQQIIHTATGSSVIPDAALKKYGYGEAPFYVRVRTYARKLNRAFVRPIEAFQVQEMNALGVSLDDLEQVNIYLQAFGDQQQDSRSDALMAKCQEASQRSLGNDEAKAFVTELDNREAELNRFANESMAAIANQLGDDVRSKLEARITEVGESIVFTKVDISKQIEMGGGNFSAYINSQCEAL
jgi:hypothetical protein